MVGWFSLISTTVRARPMVMSRVLVPTRIQKFSSHHDGPPQPFDNLPFSIPNRYVATVVFALMFGVGLWAPYLLMWYMMAKRTM